MHLAFRYMPGAVYILENSKANRVKVGMTTNNLRGRLNDANEKWLSVKVICQICGARRLVSRDGLMPQHLVSGIGCPGGTRLPLDKDVSLAELHREKLRLAVQQLSDSERGSAARRLKKLEERIELYRGHHQPEGIWRLHTAFYTNCAEQVEFLSHQILAECLDRQAPFGEVFCCSVSDASAAVESALSQLGLRESARIEVRDDTKLEGCDKCTICGGNLTKIGSCPDCAEKFAQL